MITDKMLAEAAAELNEAMLRSLPDPPDCVHSFSPSFERRMRRILRRANHPTAYRVIKSVACFILVVVLAFASLVAMSPTVRAAVVRWVKAYSETFTSYFFQSDGSDIAPEDYALENVPDGYTLLSRVDDTGFTFFCYVNPNQQLLQFSYTSNPADTSLLIVHDSHTCTQTEICGISADLYISTSPDQSNEIVWEYEGHLFSISGFLSEDALISLVEEFIKNH